MSSEIDAIAAELCLNPAGRSLLEQTVRSVQADLQQHRDILAQEKALGGRPAIVKYFKDLAKLLEKLSRHLSATDPRVDRRLQALYPRTLATLLDHHVFARHAHVELTSGVELMTDGSRVRVDRGEGLEIALAELTERKGRAAETLAPRLLRGVMLDLAQPVQAFLAVERPNPGGRPGNVERDYVIGRMAGIFRQLTGKPPTTSPGGRFVTLCDRVLEALGIDTTGLETAVPRRLRAHRRGRRRVSS